MNRRAKGSGKGGWGGNLRVNKSEEVLYKGGSGG